MKVWNEKTARLLLAGRMTSLLAMLRLPSPFPEKSQSPLLFIIAHWLSYLVCYCRVFEVHCARYARTHTRTHIHTEPLTQTSARSSSLLPSPKGFGLIHALCQSLSRSQRNNGVTSLGVGRLP